MRYLLALQMFSLPVGFVVPGAIVVGFVVVGAIVVTGGVKIK